MPVYERIAKAASSKQAWEIIQSAYKGEQRVQKARLQTLRSEFEKLEMKETESIAEYFTRTTSIVNQMASNGEILEDARVVEKILRSLPQKFDYVAVAIEESRGLSTLSLEELQGTFKAHEIRINQRKPPSSDQALKSQVISTGGRGRGFYCGRGCGRGGNFRGKGSNFRGRGRGLLNNENDSKEFEEKHNSDFTQRGKSRGSYYKGRKNNVICHYCHRPGHKISDC